MRKYKSLFAGLLATLLILVVCVAFVACDDNDVETHIVTIIRDGIEVDTFKVASEQSVIDALKEHNNSNSVSAPDGKWKSAYYLDAQYSEILKDNVKADKDITLYAYSIVLPNAYRLKYVVGEKEYDIYLKECDLIVESTFYNRVYTHTVVNEDQILFFSNQALTEPVDFAQCAVTYTDNEGIRTYDSMTIYVKLP